MADPLFVVPRWSLMVIVAGIELAVAAYLILDKCDLNKAILVFWLSTNFILYRAGNYVMGSAPCPCLGHVFDRLGVKSEDMDFGLLMIVAYLFCGSVYQIYSQTRGLKMPLLRFIPPLG